MNMRVEPVHQFNQEFQEKVAHIERKYQDACSYYERASKDVIYAEIEEALYESGNVFRDAIQKAARAQDSAEVGRLVMACLEAYQWDAACKKVGLETSDRT